MPTSPVNSSVRSMEIPLGQRTPAGTSAHQANRPQADGRPGAVTTAPFGIGLPVFSYGSCPAGPGRLDEREPGALATARFGAHLAGRGDIVFADDDGALFVPAGQAGPGTGRRAPDRRGRAGPGPQDPGRPD